MEIAVHGRHVELPSSVRRHAVQKVEHLGKYLHGLDRAEVLFSDGKKGHLSDPVSCEVTVEGHGFVVRAAATAAAPDAALEAALDKTSERLRRLKVRLVDRSRPRHRTSKQALSGDPSREEVDSP